MKNKLNSTLQLAEKTTILYTKYMLDNQKSWPQNELEIANMTLGNLSVFCHKIKKRIEENRDDSQYTEDEKNLISYELEKVEVACTSILNHLRK